METNNPPAPEDDDDGLEWLRQIRRDLLAEVGNDTGAYVRRLIERTKAHQGRVIPAPEPPPDFAERVARVMAMAPGALPETAKVAEEPPAHS